jgi:glucose-6-phosphate dehydrogenase assembly protein OpcA
MSCCWRMGGIGGGCEAGRQPRRNALSVTEEPIEALPGAPEGEIELARVERELAALWAQAAPEDPGAEPAVLRACSLNLLVLGSSPEELEPARTVAAATTLAHPSRILLLAPSEATGSSRQSTEVRTETVDRRLSPGSSNGVGARISTFCHRVGSGGRHVCCEEITLVARGAAAERLREAALPLLVPDLPVVLWLPGGNRQTTDDSKKTNAMNEGTVNRRLSPSPAPRVPACRLAELSNAVIWSARGVEDRLPAHPHRSQQPVVVDLDWLRLQPWRELTAQLFDAPKRRPLLRRLEAVEITVAGLPLGRPGAGWLWIAWLASRLGWDYLGEAAGAGERRFRGENGEVTGRVSVSEADGREAGEPLAVRLQVQGESEPLVLERLPAPEPDDLWIAVRGGRCVRLGSRGDADLLSQALGAAARDRVYEAAWETAVRLMA